MKGTTPEVRTLTAIDRCIQGHLGRPEMYVGGDDLPGRFALAHCMLMLLGLRLDARGLGEGELTRRYFKAGKGRWGRGRGNNCWWFRDVESMADLTAFLRTFAEKEGWKPVPDGVSRASASTDVPNAGDELDQAGERPTATPGEGATNARRWQQRAGVWESDDGIVIEGSAGHWFPTLGSSSGLESDTPEAAMAYTDEHYEYLGAGRFDVHADKDPT